MWGHEEAGHPAARVSMGLRLGYLVPEFPSQTHAFFWREINALRSMGESVLLLSTRKPRPLNCRHEFAAAAISQTHYLFPPAIIDLATWGVTGGRGLRRALAYLHGLEPVAATNFVRRYGLLASAIDLLQWAHRERIDHIHVQSCADAAHIVALASPHGRPFLQPHLAWRPVGLWHRSSLQDAIGHIRQHGGHSLALPGYRAGRRAERSRFRNMHGRGDV